MIPQAVRCMLSALVKFMDIWDPENAGGFCVIVEISEFVPWVAVAAAEDRPAAVAELAAVAAAFLVHPLSGSLRLMPWSLTTGKDYKSREQI